MTNGANSESEGEGKLEEDGSNGTYESRDSTQMSSSAASVPVAVCRRFRASTESVVGVLSRRRVAVVMDEGKSRTVSPLSVKSDAGVRCLPPDIVAEAA